MALKTQQNTSAVGSRILLIALLVLSLVLVAVYSREGSFGPLHGIQNAVSVGTVPFKMVSGVVGSGTDAVAESVENGSASESTLSALREQNQQLRESISQMEEYRQEAQRLEALLALRDTYKLETSAARVINRSTNAWEQVVTIDKGSNDGVTAGLTVMGPTGVVGQVIATTPFSADVRLLTDPQSGVAVLIQSNRAEGVLRGSLEGLLYLEDVSNDAKVQVGDVIVTSGLGGNYNRGLVVGMVVRVDQENNGAIRKIVVAPNSDTGPLEEVLVVLKMNSEGVLTTPDSTTRP